MSEPVTRRHLLGLLGTGLVGARLATAAELQPGTTKADGKFVLPPLGYAYDALEPAIDARTMQIHHGKHHAAYVANLNKALADQPALAALSLDDLICRLDQVPEGIRAAVRNNGGGHYNHTLFWRLMTPGGSRQPGGRLATAIDAKWGGLDKFQAAFAAASMGRFGSGWAWLVKNPKGELEITSTANQDCPLMEGSLPLLGLDVWEHAYYLKYQNRRADYVTAWWSVVNWSVVEARLG